MVLVIFMLLSYVAGLLLELSTGSGYGSVGRYRLSRFQRRRPLSVTDKLLVKLPYDGVPRYAALHVGICSFGEDWSCGRGDGIEGVATRPVLGRSVERVKTGRHFAVSNSGVRQITW